MATLSYDRFNSPMELTMRQKVFFLNFVEENTELVDIRTHMTVLSNLWNNLATILNFDDPNQTHSADRWRVSFLHWKQRLRQKAQSLCTSLLHCGKTVHSIQDLPLCSFDKYALRTMCHGLYVKNNILLDSELKSNIDEISNRLLKYCPNVFDKQAKPDRDIKTNADICQNELSVAVPARSSERKKARKKEIEYKYPPNATVMKTELDFESNEDDRRWLVLTVPGIRLRDLTDDEDENESEKQTIVTNEFQRPSIKINKSLSNESDKETTEIDPLHFPVQDIKEEFPLDFDLEEEVIEENANFDFSRIPSTSAASQQKSPFKIVGETEPTPSSKRIRLDYGESFSEETAQVDNTDYKKFAERLENIENILMQSERKSTLKHNNSIEHRLSKIEEKVNNIFDTIQTFMQSKPKITTNEIVKDNSYVSPCFPISRTEDLIQFNESLLNKDYLDQTAIRLKDHISVSMGINKAVKIIMQTICAYEVLLLHSWSGRTGPNLHLQNDPGKIPFCTYEGIFQLLFRTINLMQTQQREVVKKGLVEFLKRASQNYSRLQIK